jgi:hypothetical protein
MTIRRILLAWIAGWWGTRTAAPEPVAVAPAIAVPTPRVPREYLSLYTYLEHRYASKVVLTFGQMEDLLGFALPDAARVERGWWTETATRADHHTDAWTAARRTAIANLPAGNVAFDRVG